MLEAIQQIIDQHISPVLANHGGSIELLDLKVDGTLQIRLLGQCINCPASQTTVNDLVLGTIKEHFPSVQKIEVLESPDTMELINLARQILHGKSETSKNENPS